MDVIAQLPLVFLGGLLGSAHCVGMCGPLALALGANQDRLRTNLGRQLLFSGGRICTYGFGGALAAYGGIWLTQRSVSFVNAQAALAVVAGVVLVALGLSTAGLLPRIVPRRFAPSSCVAASSFKALLTAPSRTSAFLAGVFTGFIPCGLVYAFLAYAASAGNVLQGWATMVAFGAGTVPLMVLVGSGGTLLSISARSKLLKIAACCVVLTGLISVARGAGHLHFAADAQPSGCPFCATTGSASANAAGRSVE